MFCPNCGGNNTLERKFCVQCGTNLEVVSQALSGGMGGVLTRTDAAIDQLIARYSEHIFRTAPAKANERSLKGAWQVLGQGVVTSLVDVLLFSLMWNIFPLRFLMLLFSSPFRLLSQRADRLRAITAEVVTREPRELHAGTPEQRAIGAFASVSDHTTHNLEEHHRQRQRNKSESST
jgi:hypothetical protein